MQSSFLRTIFDTSAYDALLRTVFITAMRFQHHAMSSPLQSPPTLVLVVLGWQSFGLPYRLCHLLLRIHGSVWQPIEYQGGCGGRKRTYCNCWLQRSTYFPPQARALQVQDLTTALAAPQSSTHVQVMAAEDATAQRGTNTVAAEAVPGAVVVLAAPTRREKRGVTSQDCNTPSHPRSCTSHLASCNNSKEQDYVIRLQTLNHQSCSA